MGYNNEPRGSPHQADLIEESHTPNHTTAVLPDLVDPRFSNDLAATSDSDALKTHDLFLSEFQRRREADYGNAKRASVQDTLTREKQRRVDGNMSVTTPSLGWETR